MLWQSPAPWTPQPSPGTPSDTIPLAGFWIEFEWPTAPQIKGLLDPGLPLQWTVTFDSEKDTKPSVAQLGPLFDWIGKIKSSNLLPVIQKRYLRLQMQGHASKTGDSTNNMILSMNRQAEIEKYLDQEFGKFIEVVLDPRGDKNARPLTGIKPKDYNVALRDDRNVTVFIDATEAQAALARDSEP